MPRPEAVDPAGSARPVRLCVVIPAYNEEETVATVVRAVPRKLEGIDEVRVLVVNDGSTDRTAEVARDAGAQVLTLPSNRGVGAAIHAGFDEAMEMRADYTVNIDADGQFDPADIAKLLPPLLSGEAGFVTASRFLDPSMQPRMPRLKLWGNRFMSFLISRLTGRRFYDVSCGFRAYTLDAIQRLNLFGTFTYTQEVFLDLCFKGVAIKEIPLKIRGEREHGKSRVASNLFTYAYQTSKIIFRSFHDYKPLRVLGTAAFLMLAGALALGIFLGIWYLTHGMFTPHKWAGFTAGFLAVMGTLTMVTGLLADMLARVRMNQERILYMLRKKGAINGDDPRP